MTATTENKVDDVMERASQALAAQAYFEAERLSRKAMSMAQSANDYERMARIVLPLQEARRHRLQQALDVGEVTILHDSQVITEEMEIAKGCYLVVPMLVGADGRRVRLAALSRDVPVAVVTREPTTRLGMIPIVAVGGGMTVRTQVEPPDDEEQPDMAWFTEALRLLGDRAIETLDPIMDASRRVTGLIDRLDAVPEHEDLHQLLAETCREAFEDEQEKLAKRRARNV
jgi:hypothetical protein